MSPRQQALIAALQRGPCTTTQLERAAGYRRSSPQSRAYVAATVWRLTRLGYVIGNRNPRGSHRRAVYELRGLACERCGSLIASDHRHEAMCSPCQRAVIEQEYGGVRA